MVGPAAAAAVRRRGHAAALEVLLATGTRAMNPRAGPHASLHDYIKVARAVRMRRSISTHGLCDDV